jgi:WhiB family redox-sensing transcriptional regulator
VSATWEGLASALAGIPELPGARCRGKWAIFDETECPETTEFALNLCGSCQARAECKEWFESLPPRMQPIGVIAGRVVHQHRKAAA